MYKHDQKVKSETELRNNANQTCGADIYITLVGYIRSSKQLWWEPAKKKYLILNFVDGSEQELSPKQLMNKNYTNIGYALEKGALYYD